MFEFVIVTGNCTFNLVELTPEDAIRLARWLGNTALEVKERLAAEATKGGL